MLRRLSPIAVVLLLVALLPVAAKAETHSFLNLDSNGPRDAAGTEGPSTSYPSTVAVSGLEGTVTKVTVTVFDIGSGRGQDVDMVLVGPNGQKVMLLSDACGSGGVDDAVWTFDDAAPIFLSSLSCPGGSRTVMPTNYVGNDGPADDLGLDGGPQPPYSNQLAVLAGGSPSGDWKLFIRDDQMDILGFGFVGWVLTLEVDPPPPAPAPAPMIVTVPVPVPTPVPALAPKKTGKRAAALAKCKTKSSKEKREACRAKARKLPV